jgi:hypothetical protein
MFPTGSVTPDTGFFTSATLGSLFGPTSILALLAVVVALLVIVLGLIEEFRFRATLGRMASGLATPPVETPVESTAQVASRQQAA